MKMPLFRGFNVEKLISGVADELTPQLPEALESIAAILALVERKISELELQTLEKDIIDVFQFSDLERKSKFARGFPGVVLIGVIGRYIEPNYDPSKVFYSISPRTLFEQHIGPVLRDKYGAPMGKSDPLNVAKNENVINQHWATGKRPEYAAIAAAHLIAWVAGASLENQKKLLELLIYVYLLLARLFSRKPREIIAGQGPQEVFNILKSLVEKAPAGGNTAQAIIGSALEAQHRLFGVSGILSGVGESVFTTNTTSGKAGDLIEEFFSQTHIYEVTTKIVNLQRITESADSVLAYLEHLSEQPQLLEVTFLCLLGDVDLEGLQGGLFVFRGIRYYFVDIWGWLFNLLERLGANGRKTALELVNLYVQQNSTELKVKEVWEKLLSNVE
jgi:hypothetical protein